MRYTVRPHHVFNLVETPSYGDRLVQFVLPDDRTPMLLESAILIALMRALDVQHVFEIGTLFGVQTLNLVANLPRDGHVWTLDMDEDAFVSAEQLPTDREISRRHLAAVEGLAFSHPDYKDRVTRLIGDSTRFDFSTVTDGMQLVYVDGGHDLRTVSSDTENALSILDEHAASVVVWHDDGNPTYPDVSGFLDDLSRQRDLFHVAGTMLCMTFNSAAESIAESLRAAAAPQ